MKKISVTNHALIRFEQRFHFKIKRKELEDILSKHLRIQKASNGKVTVMNVKVRRIPCTIVFNKTQTRVIIQTIYVNRHHPNGKKYLSKIKKLKGESNGFKSKKSN